MTNSSRKPNLINKQENPMKRREFIKTITVAGIFLGTTVANFTTVAIAATADKLVDMKNAMVVALQYVHDVKDAQNRGAEKSAQYCSGCALYTGAPGSDQGPCVLFAANAPKQEVKAKGWCVSWAKKS